MANPRIEEVSDDSDVASDPEEMDLDSFDFARPKDSLNTFSSAAAEDDDDGDDEDDPRISKQAMQSLLQGQGPSQGMPQFNDREQERFQREQQERSKNFQCIYPVYFDKSRSREGGRRVKRADAVENPLARDIVDALQQIGLQHGVRLQIVFEPTKTHPRDWANPGRVKVLIKEKGRALSNKIKNKHHLYTLISTYLKAHPTTTESPMRFRIQGMPMPKDGKILPPAIPRGSKIGTILPLHSPALSGGGVSDNFLQDVMAEMGGQLPPGMTPEMMSAMGGGGSASGGGGQKKVKVRVKR